MKKVTLEYKFLDHSDIFSEKLSGQLKNEDNRTMKSMVFDTLSSKRILKQVIPIEDNSGKEIDPDSANLKFILQYDMP